MFGKKVSLTGTIKLLTIFFTLLSLISLLPSHKLFFAPIEIIANFQGYYFFFHLLACLALLILMLRGGKLFKILLLLQVLIVLRTVSIAYPYYLPAKQQDKTVAGKKVNILYANVRTDNKRYQDIIRLIDLHKPDIVGLIEMSEDWSKAMGLKDSYPYFFEKLQNDNFGIAVYSKFKFDQPISDFGDDLPPAFYSKFEIDGGKELHFILLHAFPPASDTALYRNRMLLRRISTKIRFVEGPVAVAGDFNATQFSEYFKSFLGWADLKDAFLGRGINRTWNAFNPFIRITLDHILYKNLYVISARVLEFTGSDHFPLLAELQL